MSPDEILLNTDRDEGNLGGSKADQSASVKGSLQPEILLGSAKASEVTLMAASKMSTTTTNKNEANPRQKLV